MTQYKKKQVIVEANIWGRFFSREIAMFAEASPKGLNCDQCHVDITLHGVMNSQFIVCPGDWIITDEEGERYPCKPDVFEKTYEAVPSSPRKESTSGNQTEPDQDL